MSREILLSSAGNGDLYGGSSMFPDRNTLFLITLIGYLCLFMAILPCRTDGALLDSQETAAVSVNAGLTERFIELGMSRAEAERKTELLRQSGITFNDDLIFAGGEPPADYDPPMNNIGLVFLFLGIAVGIGIYAGVQTSK